MSGEDDLSGHVGHTQGSEVKLVDTAPIMGEVASPQPKRRINMYQVGKDTDSLQNSDFISAASNFIDKNLQPIKWTIYGAFGITAVGLAFHLRLFTKFRKMDEIPLDYFIRKQKLRGIIRRRCPNTDIIYVEHTPPIKWRSKNIATAFTDGLLPVSFAGIKMTPTGQLYIDNLVDRKVWFTLIQGPTNIPLAPSQENPQSRTDSYRQKLAELSTKFVSKSPALNEQYGQCNYDYVSSDRLPTSHNDIGRIEPESASLIPVGDDVNSHSLVPTSNTSSESQGQLKVIPAIIHCRLQRSLLRRNINYTLVSYGLAKVKDFSNLEPGLLYYKDLVNDLVKAEAAASRKGIGDWPSVSYYEKIKETYFFRKERRRNKALAKNAENLEDSPDPDTKGSESWMEWCRIKLRLLTKRKS